MSGPDRPVYLRNGVLYSYGPHFPLAKWDGEWVVVVQDKSTPMTNRMRNKLRFAILQQGIKMLPITLSEAKEALGI